MGACCCCCASKRTDITSSSPFYHYPRVPEEREPLSAHSGTTSALSTVLLVDTNLDTSIPDSYRPPPSPMPYEAFAGRPQASPANRESTGNKTESVAHQISSELVAKTSAGSSLETAAKDLKESNDKVSSDIELAAPKEVEDDTEKSSEFKKSSLLIESMMVEDCPICLEEYDAENPKIVTQCEHHFHLACILEWLERSETCAVCNQEMIFDASVDG